MSKHRKVIYKIKKPDDGSNTTWILVIALAIVIGIILYNSN